MTNLPTRAVSLSLLTALALACSDGTTAPASPTSANALDAVNIGPSSSANPAGTITISFNGAMMPGMEQYVDLHQGGVTGPLMPMQCAWSADHSTLTCTPTTALTPGTAYTLHMGAGMHGSSGTPVDMTGGTHMGGTWMTGGTGGTGDGHHGQMMGGEWHDTAGHDGMLFPFTPG
jgi:hypothetical protein